MTNVCQPVAPQRSRAERRARAVGPAAGRAERVRRARARFAARAHPRRQDGGGGGGPREVPPHAPGGEGDHQRTRADVRALERALGTAASSFDVEDTARGPSRSSVDARQTPKRSHGQKFESTTAAPSSRAIAAAAAARGRRRTWSVRRRHGRGAAARGLVATCSAAVDRRRLGLARGRARAAVERGVGRDLVRDLFRPRRAHRQRARRPMTAAGTRAQGAELLRAGLEAADVETRGGRRDPSGLIATYATAIGLR